MRIDYLVAILAYLTILIVVGGFLARRVKSGEDFMVAGRSLPVHVLIGTLIATWIGTGSLMGNAGLSYRVGLAALWSPIGAAIGIGIIYFIAARARNYGGFTIPDVLETRYHPAARVMATIVTVVAYTVITSYQFRAGGRLLYLVTGMEVSTGIIITAAFVIAYTALAGMLSVAYTDFVNGVIMVIGLLLVFPLVLSQAGGIGEVTRSLDPGFFTMANGEIQGFGIWNLALPVILLLMGESNMYGRFFSARSSGSARTAVVWWLVGILVLEGIIVGLGVVGHALYPDLVAQYADYVGEPTEVIIPHLILNAVHPAIGILLIATMAAIVVSTADSFLLTPATNIVNDVWKRFFDKNLSGAREVLVLRLVVIVLGIWAYFQVTQFTQILEAALYAYTMYGAAITPAVLAAFFWKRATPAGGVASIATGMLMTIVWQSFIQDRLNPESWGAMDAVIPAMVASVTVLVGVSLATAAPDRSRWEPFFRKDVAS